MRREPETPTDGDGALAPVGRGFAAGATDIERPAYSAAKRVVDLFAAATLSLAAVPLCLVASVLILATDGPPVLYWQRRVGKAEVPFWLPKLRSMHVGADRVEIARAPVDGRPGTLPKLENDPRVTRVGLWLRRWSIDELPQLWCVLKGEMSMVGPRPSQPEEVACYGEVERGRLAVKPGITCIWQVSGRSEVPFASQMVLDLEYVENRSLLLDLELMARTVWAVLSRRGAY